MVRRGEQSGSNHPRHAWRPAPGAPPTLFGPPGEIQATALNKFGARTGSREFSGRRKRRAHVTPRSGSRRSSEGCLEWLFVKRCHNDNECTRVAPTPRPTSRAADTHRAHCSSHPLKSMRRKSRARCKSRRCCYRNPAGRHRALSGEQRMDVFCHSCAA